MISQLNDASVATVADGLETVCEHLPSEPATGVALVEPPVLATAAEARLADERSAAVAASARSTSEMPANVSPARLADVSAVGVRDLVKVFKLLSDETRLRILLYLSQRPELHVRALCDKLRQSQPAVSHHLALLRVAGLIECRREGKHNFYHLVLQRFEELLDTVFETVPSNERQIRFENYVLEYAPLNESA